MASSGTEAPDLCDAGRLRVATWNVNSIKARLAFVQHWLVARRPDVVCLQELKVDEASFPHEAFTDLGYHVAMAAQATWNGVAVIAREPVELVTTTLPGAEEAGARLVTAETSGLSVTSVYVPNGKTLSHEDYPLKLRFMDALATYARGLTRDHDQVIVGGDFNICPGDRDSHAPDGLRGSIFHTDEERALIQKVESAGLVDLYRDLYPEGAPDGVLYSWWDYRAGAFHKNLGLRIDLLLGSPAVRARTRSLFIDREYRKKKDGETPSDHAPVIADLER
ncbi:MAG: exodeoxyribonuclease III [Myxococcales bacterium]|nr:exodeoxyribonuclease III [Myxococcales bacterium]